MQSDSEENVPMEILNEDTDSIQESRISPQNRMPLSLDHRNHSYLTRRRNRSVYLTAGPYSSVLSHLPSRQESSTISEQAHSRPYMSYPRDARDNLEKHAANIVKEMEKDKTLMEDNPMSEQLRMETLREMPESLTMKRTIKQKLVRRVSQKSKHKPLSLWKSLKYRASISLDKFNLAIKNVLYSFELWYSGMKVIEGHFGSGVATYFKFLRWLFIINSIVLIFSFSFVVVPQLLDRFYEPVTDESCGLQTNSNYSHTVDNIGNTSYTTKHFSYLLLTEEADDHKNNAGKNNQTSEDHNLRLKEKPYSLNNNFTFGNILTGAGFLTDTSLYYGFYTNRTVRLSCYASYSIPTAYFFVAVISYLFMFIILSVSMARSYRRSFIETSGGLTNIYAHKLFCGWDFGIATREAADLKSKSIYNELKELLAEALEDGRQQSCSARMFTLAVQICLNIISAVLLAGTGILMWHLLTQSLNTVDQQPEEHSSSMMMSLVVTILIMVSPVFFSYLVRFEDYHNPRTVLYVTLLRTFLLKVVVIGVLIAFWLKRSDNQCWETSLGQEVYRLILTDFLIAIVGTALAEFVRKRIYKTMWEGIGVPEFDIARNTLNLIYNQTLFYVGFYFSPLLALIIVIKLFITFYIKKFGALNNCQTSSRSWRAAQTHTLFLGLAFLSLLGVLITFGYIMTTVQASDCGPFRPHKYMYQIILKGILNLEDESGFLKYLMFVTKPGVVGGMLLAMCVAVYYLRAKSHAHQHVVDILRDMLVAEAKDKEFLLSTISKYTAGQWMYNMKNNEEEQRSSQTELGHTGDFKTTKEVAFLESNSSSSASLEWTMRPRTISRYLSNLSSSVDDLQEDGTDVSRSMLLRRKLSSISILRSSSSEDTFAYKCPPENMSQEVECDPECSTKQKHSQEH